MEIRITINRKQYSAQLAHSACAGAIAEALPIEGNANTWSGNNG